MVIRKATDMDITGILALERAYFEEHEIQSLERWEASLAYQREYMHSILDRITVCEEGDAVIGHILWDDWEGRVSINSIAVSREHRRKGIAKLLMHRLEEELSGRYPTVHLQTLTTNPAQHLFDKLGYQRTGIKDGYIQYEKEIGVTHG